MNTRKLLIDSQIELLNYVQSLFDKPVYLVGGAVRDIIICKNIKKLKHEKNKQNRNQVHTTISK